MAPPEDRSQEERSPEERSPVDQLLDLVVYAPLGLLMNLDELLPQLVERGHQQVEMARMFGRFAVTTGTKEARKRLGDLAAPRTSTSVPAQEPAPASAPAAPASRKASGATSPRATAASVDGSVPDASELDIPDYDALSASQVVPRLNGLGAPELEAVRQYEAANRGRKTILSKIAQLQATPQ